MLAVMAKPKKVVADTKQPVLHMRMPEFLEEALQAFIADQRVPPDRTAVGLTALEEFLRKEGYLPDPPKPRP